METNTPKQIRIVNPGLLAEKVKALQGLAQFDLVFRGAQSEPTTVLNGLA
jgi:hypothetical protein